METQNVTSPVTEFVLLGFSHSLKIQKFLFTVFFIIFLMTCLGNITIITTVITDSHLHTPMYFFLANLAFTDLTESSVNTPVLLAGLLSQHRTAPFKECILHIFLFHFIGGAHIFLLAVMAADRSVAIHRPLQYLTIMTRELCLGLVAGSWAAGFIHSVVQIALLLPLPYCGLNTLDNFHCDVPQVLKVACVDTHLTELLMVSNGGLILIVIFVLLLVSYTGILVKIRRQVTGGKHKGLSTCLAQILAISITFIPGIFIYARPFKTFEMDKVASIFFTVIVPVLNPMVYTLRNTEMKKAIRKLFSRVLF